MGLVSKIVKLGIAKKVYDEARKPENQRRIKQAISSMQNKANQRSARGRRPRT